jgi:hypothetical protein
VVIGERVLDALLLLIATPFALWVLSGSLISREMNLAIIVAELFVLLIVFVAIAGLLNPTFQAGFVFWVYMYRDILDSGIHGIAADPAGIEPAAIYNGGYGSAGVPDVYHGSAGYTRSQRDRRTGRGRTFRDIGSYFHIGCCGGCMAVNHLLPEFGDWWCGKCKNIKRCGYSQWMEQ